MRMAAYAVHRRRRLDPDLAVFYCLWGRPPVGNPAAIAAELARVRPSVRTVWLIRPGSVRSVPEGTDMVVLDSRAAQSVLARATYLVSDVNFPDHVRRRPGQVMLETQHGTPLKFMGLDMQRFEIPSSTMDYERLMKRVDVWTYNLSSNAYSTEVWRRAFPARYRMLEFGYPRNDRLVNATAEDTAAMRELLGIPEGHRVVLYAPTHRDYRKGFTTDLDVERLMAALPEDTTLLVRGHYFYAGRTAKAVAVAERIRNVSEHRQIEDLYLAADVMVTDYSSAMFDFANLGRPIVIHAPDIERYRATRGIYFDITAEPPGAVTRTDEELATVLADGSYASPENDALLAVFRQRFCQFDDGHAAERVVRAVFLGEDVEPPGSVHGTPPPLRTWVTDRAG